MKRISSIFLMILFPSLLFSAAMDNSAWVDHINDSAAIKANKTDEIIAAQKIFSLRKLSKKSKSN